MCKRPGSWSSRCGAAETRETTRRTDHDWPRRTATIPGVLGAASACIAILRSSTRRDGFVAPRDAGTVLRGLASPPSVISRGNSRALLCACLGRRAFRRLDFDRGDNSLDWPNTLVLHTIGELSTKTPVD